MSGILMLILNILLLAGIIALFVWAVSNYNENTPLKVFVLIVDTILFFLNCLFWGGLMQIETNEAMVLVFFGKYSGTIKKTVFIGLILFTLKRN
jgi:hypothetical protein